MYNICIIWPVFLLVSAVFFNEFLIYYLKIGATCGWPEIGNEREQPLRAFMIADTHLLGIYKGHWLDKLKREWQMKRGFHTAVSVLSPEVVFFLGDLLDEGKWSTREMFNGYSEEFRRLFATHVPTYAVAGNHDVGFHYEFLPQGIDWFRENFNRSLVDTVSIRETHFVFVNSMAFHGDGCLLCRRAEEELDKVSKMLDCARKQDCNGTDTFSPYSRPILLLHFPLFRKDESDCLRDSEFDYSAPKRDEEYRPKWESLSEEATRELIKKLSPRAVFNGHSHRDCKKRWTRPQNFWEYTVNSFSWRNGDRPAFLLVQITRNEISVSTCFLPNESTTIIIYVVCGTILLIWLLSRITTCLSCRKRARTTSFPLLPQTKEDKSD